MSAGVLWVVLPLVIALLLLLLTNYAQVSMIVAAVINTAMVILILAIKIDHNYIIGSTLLRIEPVFSILGRTVLIENADRVILLILYGLSAVYIWLGVFSDPTPSFAPFSIAIAALLTAALTVESRLFFILFVELAVLLCLPLLVKQPGKKERGEHFLLIFVTLSIPLLLLGGWAADAVASNPIDTEMIDRAVVFMVLGYSLMIGVFPFFFWMPQISENTRPVRANFVLSILSFSFLYLLFSIGDAGSWLRSDEVVLRWIQVMGLLMIAVGGVWAAFQSNISRYFAFGLIIDNGFGFLAMRSALNGSPDAFSILLTTRLIVYFLFTIASVYLDNRGVDLTIDGIRGRFREYPFAFILLFYTIFSFNALPLMANFTVRFSILQSVLSDGGIEFVIWPLIGQLGFFLGALRFLGSAVDERQDEERRQEETWPERVVFMAGMLLLVLFGFLPSPISAWILGLWSGFG
ncbi:MAG: proton-conducting transporter membrane subunit [Anaerolineae bacterium]|jgi:formate hydrogenlyase subunit 3/multisubunit Na+/H+ antiporter MnhD subunit|nr:proton-conducting transporter membrane subunit [Anaerolineae bacterium]